MMTIYFMEYDKQDLLRRPDPYFKRVRNKNTMEGEFIDRIVTQIDKSPRIFGNVFESPIFGSIGPDELSGGVKSLTMIYNNINQVGFSSVCFGDNCIPFLIELSHIRDFDIVLQHPMYWMLYKDEKVSAITEDGKVLNTAFDIVKWWEDREEPWRMEEVRKFKEMYGDDDDYD